MNSVKSILCLALIFCLGQSCKTEDPYAKMAQETCTCLTPLSELYQKVQQLSDEGQTNDLIQLMTELEVTAQNAEDCTTELSEKYGEPEDEDKATEAMRKICPVVVETMEQLEEGLE
jgi:hypothetical protein